MGANWYTLRVKPHKERSVSELLTTQAIDCFLPLVKVNPKNPRAAKVRPYFPGYMFVYADLDELGANKLNWTVGAHGLVQFGGEPAVVPQRLIDQLQEQLFAIEKAGGLVFNKLNPGDTVRIKSGPFAGYEAIFDAQLPGQERVQVLLAFLSSHPQRVKLDASDIEKT